MTSIKTYISLTKPGIIMGNLITAAGGFALASRGVFDFSLLGFTLLGISLVIGSGCVFNNYIDRRMDAKMARTRNRALVKGLISIQKALIYAFILGILGVLILGYGTNSLTTYLTVFGLLAYVFLYSFSKYHTVYGTLIGSIAGAMPPVIGYTAVTSSLDLGALLLFLIVGFWQMPHFYAIAIYRLKEYTAAAIPVFPLKKGIKRTKIHMFLYVMGFIVVSSLLFLFHFTGYAYLGVTWILGGAWLYLAYKGFKAPNNVVWARKMFLFSLIVIMGVCITIPFSS